MNPFDYSDLSAYFVQAADNQFSGIGATASPLYAALARGVAQDADLLALASQVPKGQPVSNLLFSSIYFLLLDGIKHPAADFFQGVVAQPLPVEHAFPAVRDFCLSHREQLIPMLRTRRVQTNEVQRSAIWVPAFEHLARVTQQKPLAMLEIGASAGLNLHWDRHFYRYGERTAGNSAAALHLSCIANGTTPPPLPTYDMPNLAWRAGIDLNPIDVHADAEVSWLRALIWPEQTHRVTALANAVAVARQHPVTLHRGDAAALVPTLLTQVPDEHTICLCHSFTWNQCPEAVRAAMTAALEHTALQRDVYRLSYEWLGERPMLECFLYRRGTIAHKLLAYVDSHGRHIEWL